MSILEYADLIMDSGSCPMSFCMEDDQIVPDLLTTPTDSSILESHSFGNGGQAVNSSAPNNFLLGFPVHQVWSILLLLLYSIFIHALRDAWHHFLVKFYNIWQEVE